MDSRERLNASLREFVRRYGVPLGRLAAELDISASECMEWWSGRRPYLPVQKIKNLTHHLGATEEDLVSGQVSPLAVESQLLGFESEVNPRYSENAFSYVRSSKHIVEFIRLRHGAYRVNKILHKLGVPPHYFNEQKNRISIKFFEDLLLEYVRMGHGISDIHDLSKFLYLSTDEDPEVHRLFSRCRGYKEALEYVYQSTCYFDENFSYEFEIYHDRVKIRSKPTQKLQEAMRSHQYGSNELYQYRSRLFGNMVGLCDLLPLSMKTVKCVSQGDHESVYEAEFPGACLRLLN